MHKEKKTAGGVELPTQYGGSKHFYYNIKMSLSIHLVVLMHNSELYVALKKGASYNTSRLHKH